AGTSEGYRFLSGESAADCSYTELFASALRMASALAETGLKPGDLVAIVIADAEQFLTALFGVSLARGIPAPLSPPALSADTHDAERTMGSVFAVVQAAAARAVVTTASFKSFFAPVFERLGSSSSTSPRLELVLTIEELGAFSMAAPPALEASALS